MDLFLTWVACGILSLLVYAQCFLVDKLFKKMRLQDKSSNTILLCSGFVLWLITGEMFLILGMFSYIAETFFPEL